MITLYNIKDLLQSLRYSRIVFANVRHNLAIINIIRHSILWRVPACTYELNKLIITQNSISFIIVSENLNVDE